MGGGTDSNNLGALSGTQNLMLGMLAGVCSKACNYPLLVWKNASQQGLEISLNPLKVYRGLPMACINLGGTTAVQFYFTGAFQSITRTIDGKAMPGGSITTSLFGGAGTQSSSGEMVAALMAGACSGIPCSVWELTMIQQQRYGGSLVGTPLRIAQKHGATTLFRGLTTTIGREGLYTMSMLGVTPVLQREIVRRSGLEPNVALAFGSVAGASFSAVATHPLDTIKTCMQGDVEQKNFKGVTDTYSTLLKEGGAGSLFRGLGWRIALISTTFFLVNKFKGALAPIIFEDAFQATGIEGEGVEREGDNQ